MSPSDDLNLELEERADYIPDDSLVSETAINDFYTSVTQKLLQTGTKLLIGPRGCGKTHLMRYTYLRCTQEKSLPFAIYASFNRYYRLEPLLQSRTTAIHLFHTWALALIVQGLYRAAEDFADGSSSDLPTEQDRQLLAILIGKLERGQTLSEDEDAIAQSLSVPTVQGMIADYSLRFGRRRTILLLDDAALTLTREYLFEFFDVIRAIRSSTISPKASVYPGTTEYGPNFHVSQEAERVSVWLSPEDTEYAPTMRQVASKRISNIGEIPAEVVSYLMYAAFGVPRAFLILLRGFQRREGHTTQSTLNRIIEEHSKARLGEYLSLRLKIPTLTKIIDVGGFVFARIVDDLKATNGLSLASSPPEKQMVVGISDTANLPHAERMLSLLLEAGLLHETQSVSHGKERTYRRFLVNLAVLLDSRAFSSESRGTSARQIVDIIENVPSAKHPLRRKIDTLLGQEKANLEIDLPPCTHCNEPRLSPTQRFCHNCGSQLADASAFVECMKVKLVDVPGLTSWQREKINDLESIRTIGDLLAMQDPGTELRRIPLVGEKRASKIVRLVTGYVDDFLS